MSYFSLHRIDEIFSVTQTIQQEEIEQEEVIEHSQESIQTTTVCVDEAGDIIEEDGEIEEEEMDEEAVFALALSEDSECEDKEYMGKLCMHTLPSGTLAQAELISIRSLSSRIH